MTTARCAAPRLDDELEERVQAIQLVREESSSPASSSELATASQVVVKALSRLLDTPGVEPPDGIMGPIATDLGRVWVMGKWAIDESGNLYMPDTQARKAVEATHDPEDYYMAIWIPSLFMFGLSVITLSPPGPESGSSFWALLIGFAFLLGGPLGIGVSYFRKKQRLSALSDALSPATLEDWVSAGKEMAQHLEEILDEASQERQEFDRLLSVAVNLRGNLASPSATARQGPESSEEQPPGARVPLSDLGEDGPGVRPV